MPEKTWYNIFFKVLDHNKESISHHDIRFYNIRRLSLIAEKIDDLSVNCKDCKNYKKELMEIAENIEKYINTSTTNKRKYEQKISKIKKHLSTIHHIRTFGYYMNLYTLFGILSGLFTGIIFLWALSYEIKLNIILLFIIPFMAGGRILGYLKDKKKNKLGEQI